jgi:predicted aldo/keto reductase-like oxidoreductase
VRVVLSVMSELDQMRENVRIACHGLANSLTRRELALIQEAKAIYQAKIRVDCTNCGYCLPCPHGVSIPANFLQLNNLSIYRDRDAAEFFYFHILNEEQRASNCEECGQCEDLCPQHIPIRNRLKEVVEAFESPPA